MSNPHSQPPHPSEDRSNPVPDTNDVPQTPPQSAASSATGEPVVLLQQILNRLQRMEGGLSQHEQWLRRIELEQRPAEPAVTQAAAPVPLPTAGVAGAPSSELNRLIGALTLDRDRANKTLAEAQAQLGQYQQELLSLRKQIAEMQNKVLERDRQLSTLKETVDKHRQQAGSLQTEAGRQLKQRQDQLEQLQARLAGIEQQAAARERQLQAALDEAAARLQSLSAARQETSDTNHAPRFNRIALAASLAAALVSTVLTAWLYQRAQSPALYTASALVTAPRCSAQALERAAATTAQRHPGLEAIANPKFGTIELRLDTPDAKAGVATLNALAAKLVEQLPQPNETAASQPASQPEGRTLAARIARATQQLATTSQPAAAALTGGADLPGNWKTHIEERVRLLETLGQLAARIEPKSIGADAAKITAEQVAQAESSSPQLRTEFEALKSREDQLAGRLVISIEAAGVQFQNLRETLTAADAYLQKLSQESHPEEVSKQLQAIRDSLKTWDHALNGLEEQWRTQRGRLGAAGTPDALAVQGGLEKSARQFVTDVVAASDAQKKAIELIGQGQDQTTKRLVLRNALVKELAPATGAQEAVLTSARSVILTENVELTAIVQRLDALRRQVEQRRAQIAASVQQDRLNRLQQEQATQVADARRQHAQITQRLTELDGELLALGGQAVQWVADASHTATALAARLSAQEQRAEALAQLLQLHERFAGQIAAAPVPAAPGLLPARLLSTDSGAGRSWTPLLVGLLPLLGCAITILVTAQVLSSRRSHETIEAYARSLKEMSRGT